ncbi:MAG TPA: glycosyltransferase family 4 protein [Spirochaetota bacterium]|nr:glycosyltransferase family 4 protein [Spirochaetota bacterium]
MASLFPEVKKTAPGLISGKTKILYVGNKISIHGYTPCVIETLGRRLEEAGYEVYYAGTVKNQALRSLEMLWKTLVIGRKVKYILIDTYSTVAFWYAYLTGLVARLIKTKYIPILHGGNLPSRLMESKRACNTLFGNSYANVAVSGYLSHEFEKAGYKTVIIPNSIVISKYPFKLREHPCPKLLWVRSFHRQYNPEMAADVLKELLKTYPDAELCMVGPDKDGSLGEFKNYINLLGIGDKVKITGLLKKEEWIKLSENYDFFINTTNVDNTPISVIEAMALGMIVISTDAGGLKYLLSADNNSIMVSCGDAIAMSKAISAAMNDQSLCKKMSLNARYSVMNFDWSRVKNKWVGLLLADIPETKSLD